MRQFVRYPTDIPIDVRVADISPAKGWGSYMTSVGQGGMSCRVDRAMSVGSVVDIDILSVSPPYQGKGEVVWCRPTGKHFDVGVRFTNHAEAYKSRMVQQVCQIEHYKNLVFEREGRVLDGNQAAAEWIEKYAAEFH